MRSIANFQPHLFERSETKDGELRAFANPSGYQSAFPQHIDDIFGDGLLKEIVLPRNVVEDLQQAGLTFHLHGGSL